jgi:nickel-dependent lactate racemase
MMRIKMKYGKAGLDIDFPEDWSIVRIEKKDMPLLENPKQAMRQALDNPVGATPLKEDAQNASSACILICDITRPLRAWWVRWISSGPEAIW